MPDDSHLLQIAEMIGAEAGWLRYGGPGEESPESAAGAWRVGETPADYRAEERPDASIAALARTMLVGMQREGKPIQRVRGAWLGLRTTLVEALGTVPQWWFDEWDKIGGGTD